MIWLKLNPTLTKVIKGGGVAKGGEIFRNVFGENSKKCSITLQYYLIL